MSAETVTRTIQLILAPVVMMTACSILVGGLQVHYQALNDRLRAMTRERLDLLRSLRDAAAGGGAGDPLGKERLEEIDAELPELLRRHGLMHHAVLAVYLAILILVASMCTIAFAATVSVDWIATGVLVLFAAGLVVLLVGVLLVALEIRGSHHAIGFEVRRVLGLGR